MAVAPLPPSSRAGDLWAKQAGSQMPSRSRFGLCFRHEALQLFPLVRRLSSAHCA